MSKVGNGYRPDIDGLRALAVVPVVLYHLGFGLFPGGYVGVDVFFVISGYLITGIIQREIDAGQFSIITFYERRARRILPALFATLAVTSIVSTFILMPDELRDLGYSLIGVVTFCSNILFWKQTDYFAGPVEFKPLIHTWSLAVEEQFYIIFPIFLMLIARFYGRRYVRSTLILAIISFALSVIALDYDPTGNYYLLPTRAWELMIGSLLAYRRATPMTTPYIRECGAAVGFALIIGSALLLTEQSPFPGYNALWPCIGAALIIATGEGSQAPTFVARLLGSLPFRGVGLISYSLYLVHWPLFVLVKYQLLRDPTVMEQVLMAIAAFALAYLSWRFVEQPFRNRQAVSQKAIFATALFLGLVTSGAGAAAYKFDGFPDRFGLPRVEKASEQANAPGAPTCFLKGDWQVWSGAECLLAKGKGGNILFWGDSHVNHYRAVILRADPPLDVNILMYASAGCLPIFDYGRSDRPYCRSNNDHVRDIIRDYHIDTVILSGYWWRSLRSNDLTVADVAKTVDKLKALGVQVKIVGDNPDFPFANPQFLAYRLGQNGAAETAYYMPVRNDFSINPQLSKLVPAEDFFDPMTVLCKEKECLAYDHGQIVMVDNSHLSGYGSRIVFAKMRPLFVGNAH